MEEYIPLDFHQGSISYWTRAHNPSRYEHYQPRKPHEIKEYVLHSKRIKTTISEVCVSVSVCAHDIQINRRLGEADEP